MSVTMPMNNIVNGELMLRAVLFVLFFLVLVFVPRFSLKTKSKKLQNEIGKDRKIISKGYFKINHNGGFLFLTETALEFYYYKKGINNFYILLKDIESVLLSGDLFWGYKMIVKTASDEIVFYPDKAQLLKNNIEKLTGN